MVTAELQEGRPWSVSPSSSCYTSHVIAVLETLYRHSVWLQEDGLYSQHTEIRRSPRSSRLFFGLIHCVKHAAQRTTDEDIYPAVDDKFDIVEPIFKIYQMSSFRSQLYLCFLLLVANLKVWMYLWSRRITNLAPDSESFLCVSAVFFRPISVRCL